MYRFPGVRDKLVILCCCDAKPTRVLQRQAPTSATTSWLPEPGGGVISVSQLLRDYTASQLALHCVAPVLCSFGMFLPKLLRVGRSTLLIRVGLT